MNKVLVTGATGFIGNYVIHELCSRENVHVIAAGRNQSKLSLLNQEYNIEIMQFDIYERKDDWYTCTNKPDILIHLAWDELSDYNNLDHLEEILVKHYIFLKNIIKNGLKQVSITGTCFEYGLQEGGLYEDLLTMPVTAYGLAKDTLHKALNILQFEHKFMLQWMRLFYVFGKGQNPKSLLSSLEKAIKNGDNVFNMSGGDQLRDFVHAEKAAELIVDNALNNNSRRIYNICSGTPISVRMLIEDRIKELNSNISLNLGYYPYPDYEPMSFWGKNRSLP